MEHRWNDSLIPGGPLRVSGARARIHESNVANLRRFLVIDDDPTGSQAVHGVDAVLTMSPEMVAQALSGSGSTCFVLTNSRSRDTRDAYAMSYALAELAADLERRIGGHVELVSRSDSTLRGHFRAEIDALRAARRSTHGRPYDGILVIPSYFEAGRFTAGDTHWARVGGPAGGRVLAVGATEFSADKTFGYASSTLPEFVEEKYEGTVTAADVHTLSLVDIRSGGPDRVAEKLTALPRHGETFVAVNAVDYDDLDVVVLGLELARVAGRSFLYRAGPSFVQSLSGLPQFGPLTAATARPLRRDGHGLVVVGSHVDLTTRQVERLLVGGDVTAEVIDVESLLSDAADRTVAEVAERIDRGLDERDVVVLTSRTLVSGPDGATSLEVARAVSRGLVGIVERVAHRRLPWIVTKGGITSHDILAHALRVRRATVAGQLFPGAVSVFHPVEARPEVVGIPCVVFAGNVGDEKTLRTAVEILRG